MKTEDINYHIGLPEKYRDSAVDLYDEAFGQKFAVAIPSKKKRILFLKTCLTLDYVISAIHKDKLIGIAGFQTPEGSLTGSMTYSELISQLGFIKGNWAAVIFTLYERKAAVKELIMDGIAVHSDARGKGVGSHLLKEVAKYAKDHKFNSVRLDVIDINPKAKILYERMGFKSVKIESYPYLKWLLGFSGSTTMELTV
ncbi:MULTISPECIES: GNAT family N-acetyltransferase [unclassified Marinobacter]|uniref:GNAT family N-acetyltransferase n=1 Tax=unclassified Marinobacter TaxID=83889 RepID=UPI000BF996D6|nr:MULTISPECIES: GNAT family N-acetyltransferase [unclassified Marinobacter]PFG10768.1 acetyltransferase (GNAT) family protein [Marinobacter sp. LV10MA510-1]PFG52663.1 acetyltransferase (GNAT) family protein [Marinobacter sp. LV10R520-4]